VERLREVLVAGRELEPRESGRRTIEVTDAYGRSTEAILITPRGYDPGKPAGVLFLLHGLGGEGSQLAGLFNDFASANGYFIVCPTAQPLPPDRPHPDTEVLQQFPQLSGVHWWSYWSGNFVMSLLKQLGRELAIDRDRVVLSGYSMGGFGTWNIGMRFHQSFAALVPFAGGISGQEYLGGEDSHMRSLLPNLSTKPLYFVHGTADTTVPARFDQRSDAMLEELGSKTHVYLEVPGGSHRLDVRPGSQIVRGIEKWMKGKERSANPKEIVHHVLDPDHGACHWLQVDELSGSVGKVRARLRGKGKLEIQAEGVARLTVRLNAELAKPGKKVQVKANGKTAYKGTPEPSLRDLLETWRETEDPALLYDTRIRLELQ
jgi:predicted esterase